VAGTYRVTQFPKYLAKFESPRAITRPKLIGPERNVSLICNLSVYTHIRNIKSISQSIATKRGDNLLVNWFKYDLWWRSSLIFIYVKNKLCRSTTNRLLLHPSFLNNYIMWPSMLSIPSKFKCPLFFRKLYLTVSLSRDQLGQYNQKYIYLKIS
jgi:hypothetical protein